MFTVALRFAALVLAANPYLNDARRLVDELHYPQAEALLRTANKVPTNTPAERREICDLLARAVVAQGRTAEAEAFYAELLAADPDAPSPKGVSPKIRDAFVHAKQRVFPPGFVRLAPLPSPPGRLAVQLVDPWQGVAEVVLQERLGTAPFAPRTVSARGREYGVDLPPLPPGAELQAYFEARSTDGQVLATLGTAAQPMSFKGPPAPESVASARADSTPIATEPLEAGPPRWPKWVAGGVAVAAAAVGAAFGVAAAQDSKAAGSATLAARDVRSLDASAREKALVANVCVGGALVAGAGAVVLAWKW